MPIGILPIGTDVEVDFDNKTITLVECPIKIVKFVKKC